MTRISEVELDHAFAEGLLNIPGLLPEVLKGGRFARFALQAHLLDAEQATARPRANHWWKHWWCRLPDGSESETDVFIVLDVPSARFALHVENKPADGKLTMKQAVDYRRRATFKANDPTWLNYTDFETVLMCPAQFAIEHPECASQFDRVLSYEHLAQTVPTFAAALINDRH